MKQLEKILILTTLLGIILKLLDIQYSSLVLFISIVIISSIYFFLGFALFNNIRLRNIFKPDSFNSIKPIRVILTVGIGWGYSILSMGILFGILYYPMKEVFLVTGLILTTIFLLIFLIAESTGKFRNISGIIIRGFVIIIMAAVLLAFPTSSNKIFHNKDQTDTVETTVLPYDIPENGSTTE